MSVLAPAVGAVVAAILESSVLTHLQLGSVRLDLVFALGIAVAMTLGFESGMTWAFVGGVTLDLLLPGRVLGASALSLVLATGVALLIARAFWPPRLIVVAVTAFLLAFVYHAVGLGLLAFSDGLGLGGISLPELLAIATLDAVAAGLAVPVIRALDLRFGDAERLAW